MDSFLRKLKLIDSMTTELQISRNDFVARLQQIVEDRSIGFIADSFDPFFGGTKTYKGQVGLDGFTIKRMRRFFDFNMNIALAKGTFRQHKDGVIVETEINGFRRAMIPLYLLLIFVYVFSIVMILTGPTSGQPISYMIFPFILIHALLMFGAPYYVMRRSTSRLKYELEREFYFLTKG